MIAAVKATPNALAGIVRRLRIPRTEIARRYGCSEQFVYAVLSGRSACPQRMAELLRRMISERADDLSGAIRSALEPPRRSQEGQGL